MSITCTPTLTVDGVPVALGGSADLVAVDELAIPWGRGSLLDRATPSTASLTVRDTGRGAPFASRLDLVGRPLLVGWTGSDGSSGVLFRGRITDPAVRPRRLGGYEVSLAASSKEVDAANHTLPEGTTWPAENLTARRARILAVLPAGLYPGSFLYPTRDAVGLTDVADPSRDFGSYLAAPADVGGRNVLELLHELFESTYPVPLVYDPSRDAFGYVARRRYAYNPQIGTGLSAGLRSDPERAGRYVAAPLAGAPTVALDASDLAYSGDLVQPLESLVTRVEVGYTTSAGASATASVMVYPDRPTLEDSVGRRVLSVGAVLSEPGIALQLATQWGRLAGGEAAAPRLGPLTWDTRRSPFPTADHVKALLRSFEGGAQAFIGGAWSAALGGRPLYGFIGGQVSYAGGDWSIEVTPAPVGVEWPTTPLTVNTAASSAGVTLASVDPSVTLADLAFVDVGAGYTAATQPLWNG